MSLALIAAVSENGCIGNQGQLPWHLPEDLKHFKKLTEGKVVIMGRKTWESLPEKFRPLPNRLNTVITTQQNYQIPPSAEKYQNIDEAIAAHAGKEIMIIGGATMYKQCIDKASVLYITEVRQHVDGDAFFPNIDKTVWKETAREDHSTFSFVTYEKS